MCLGNTFGVSDDLTDEQRVPMIDFCSVSSYYKGYDVILLDDISATTSPLSATQMVDYNAGLNGWRANSTDILAAIQKAAKRHE